jgi:DNA-binding NtrC family response regulator
MDGRGLIIADKDPWYRSCMAGFFRKAGYRVKTTDSFEVVLDAVLEKEVAVLLLGSNLVESVTPADLIHLLKFFKSPLQIIVVSDGLPPGQTRKVRAEGIFYHALKPAAPGDTDELRQAVACAFERYRDSAQPAPASREPAAKTGRNSHWSPLSRAMPWVACAVALATGASQLPLIAAQTMLGGLAIGLFLGLCALVVVCQMLPVFRVKLAPQWRWARKRASGPQQNGK